MDQAVLAGLEEFMDSEKTDPGVLDQVKAYQADTERTGGAAGVVVLVRT